MRYLGPDETPAWIGEGQEVEEIDRQDPVSQPKRKDILLGEKRGIKQLAERVDVWSYTSTDDERRVEAKARHRRNKDTIRQKGKR